MRHLFWDEDRNPYWVDCVLLGEVDYEYPYRRDNGEVVTIKAKRYVIEFFDPIMEERVMARKCDVRGPDDFPQLDYKCSVCGKEIHYRFVGRKFHENPRCNGFKMVGNQWDGKTLCGGELNRVKLKPLFYINTGGK